MLINSKRAYCLDENNLLEEKMGKTESSINNIKRDNFTI